MANDPSQFEFDVFLSHNAKDKPRVRRLAERLRDVDLRVWFDEWVIRPGDDIYLTVEHGLEASRTLILFMSSNAFGSDWVALTGQWLAPARSIRSGCRGTDPCWPRWRQSASGGPLERVGSDGSVSPIR